MIAVLIRDREQGRFGGSSKGARGSSKKAKGEHRVSKGGASRKQIENNNYTHVALTTFNIALTSIFDPSPVSHGVQLRSGYYEMVPQHTPLPCSEFLIFETAIDDIYTADIQILCFPSPLSRFMQLRVLRFEGIQIAKAGIPKSRNYDEH